MLINKCLYSKVWNWTKNLRFQKSGLPQKFSLAYFGFYMCNNKYFMLEDGLSVEA